MKRAQPADLAFILALGAATLLLAQFVIRPGLADVRQKQSRLLATRTDIVRSEDFTRGLDDLQRYLDEFAIELAELDRLVPMRADPDERIREVDGVVKRCGLVASSIRPDPPQPKGSVVAHPLLVKVEGRYPSVERFLFEIEALPRHSRVTRFQVSRIDGAGVDPTVRAEIELTAFSVDPAATRGAQ